MLGLPSCSLGGTCHSLFLLGCSARRLLCWAHRVWWRFHLVAPWGWPGQTQTWRCGCRDWMKSPNSELWAYV